MRKYGYTGRKGGVLDWLELTASNDQENSNERLNYLEIELELN